MKKWNGRVALVAALWAGSALAAGYEGWHGDPAADWQPKLPAYDPGWGAPAGLWEAPLSPAYPVEVDVPGFGDWNIGIEPPRDGEVRCMAIGCEKGGAGPEVITIPDCRKGPC